MNFNYIIFLPAFIMLDVAPLLLWQGKRGIFYIKKRGH
jgi:hypothetical protein